jgi:hypothetical protein
MSGLLLIPEWPTEDFWLEIFNRHGHLVLLYKVVSASRPFLIQKNLDCKFPFHGKAKFNFLEISFSSHQRK